MQIAASSSIICQVSGKVSESVRPIRSIRQNSKKTSSLTWIFNELYVSSTFKCPIKLKDTKYTLMFDCMNVKFNFRACNLTVHDFRTCKRLDNVSPYKSSCWFLFVTLMIVICLWVESRFESCWSKWFSGPTFSSKKSCNTKRKSCPTSNLCHDHPQMIEH